jgi:hypothetical protein
MKPKNQLLKEAKILKTKLTNVQNQITRHEKLRMQMLAGIITEGQYKVKLNEEMGDEIENSTPSPGDETEKLRNKAANLYHEMLDLFMDNKYYNDEYIDTVILNSIPYDIRQKVADENGGSLGTGSGYSIGNKFVTEKELRKIIQVLEGVFKLVSNSEEGEDDIDFKNYLYDRNKGEWIEK